MPEDRNRMDRDDDMKDADAVGRAADEDVSSSEDDEFVDVEDVENEDDGDVDADAEMPGE
jgi:hypothetical protein